MNAANQRHLTPWLAVLAALLGALLLMLLAGIGRGVHWKSPRSQPPLPPAGNPADLPQPLPLEQFALVWQKPLFNPDRKPVSHAVDGGSSLGDLDLTGIILTPRLRIALLHDKNGNRELRLREGESLPDGSVTLVEVHPRSALFDAPSGRTELKLPAGAPIDDPKAVAGAADDSAPPPGDAMMRVDNGGGAAADPAGRNRFRPARGGNSPGQPPDDNTRASFLERLRENVRKRRAAHSGAAPAGVR